ncbi:MAG: exosortase/archaeosortase family protein [Tepidisphaeraceae bacterium]
MQKTFRSNRLTAWHLLAATGMAALGVAATYEPWHDIYTLASKEEEYSHIFLVPIVALAMVLVRRMRMRHCRPSGAIVGVILVAVGWATTSYGFHHAVQALWHAGAVVVVLGCILSVLGKNVMFRFFPAILVLVFMVPVPGTLRQKIALPLQTWTARTAQTGLEICGVETELSGNTLSINGRPVKVVEACNGMRMVFPLILVSYAFCFALPLRNSVRFLLLLASPLVAIFCNVLRTLPTIWLYGNRSDIAEEFHKYSGWAMLLISFLVLLGIIKALKWAMLPLTRFPLASQYA